MLPRQVPAGIALGEAQLRRVISAPGETSQDDDVTRNELHNDALEMCHKAVCYTIDVGR